MEHSGDLLGATTVSGAVGVIACAILLGVVVMIYAYFAVKHVKGYDKNEKS